MVKHHQQVSDQEKNQLGNHGKSETANRNKTPN